MMKLFAWTSAPNGRCSTQASGDSIPATAEPAESIPAESPNITPLDEIRARIDRYTVELDHEGTQQLAEIATAIEHDNFDEARRQMAALDWGLDLLEITHQIREILPPFIPAPPVTPPAPEPQAAARKTVPIFHVGTMNLCAWHPLLMPPEKELALSGVEVSPGVISLDQAIPLKAAHASSVAFQPENASVYESLKRFERFGYRLRAYIHSQPGLGPESTRPSGKDLETQRNLEKAYRCIGLIMNQEGYLRAFSADMAFDLSIYGDNVEVIDAAERVYKLRLA